MIEYLIRPARARFASQEPVSLNVTIRNTGRFEVDLPNPTGAGDQPLFVLAGPSPDQKRSFTAADLSRSVFNVRAIPPRIAVGQRDEWHGVLYLTEQTGITGSGAYQFASQLIENRSTIRAEPCRFEVDPFQPEAYAGGFSLGPDNYGEGHIAFLHSGDGAKYIYLCSFIEHRPGIGEARTERPVLMHIAGPDAIDLTPAYSAGPYFQRPEQWVAWREQNQIHFASTLGLVNEWQNNSIGSLIRPILQTPDGSLQFAALSPERNSVTFAFLPPGRGSAVQPPWELPLSAPVHTATAQLNPARPGEGHIAAISSGPEGVTVHHVRYSGSRFPDAFNTVTIPGCRPLDASPDSGVVAIQAKEDGSASVGTLVMTIRSESPAYVEMNFPADRAGSVGSIARCPRLESAVTAAALHLRTVAGSVQATGVVQLSDKRVLRYSDGSFDLTPVRGEPALPLIMVPGREVTYGVFTRDDGSPYLDRV